MMAFVHQVPEAQAEPRVQELYQQIRAQYGFIPNYFQAQGRLPEAIEGQLALGNAVLKDGALSQALKEQIGLVVSGLNSSSYCIAIHMQVLHSLGVEESLGQKLAVDYTSLSLPERELALFRFAEKLTREPAEIERRDVEELLKVGWSEGALVEAVLAVAWFNLVNRVSLGLGLVADS
jgi:uncharacterized peroxidase-related enzyme